MYNVHRWVLAIALLWATSIAPAQTGGDVAGRFEIVKGSDVLFRWTAAEMAAMPRASLTVKDDGLDVRYEGVWMHELLDRAGLPLGPKLRGEGRITGVIAEASDGYRVLFTLAELDASFREPHVLVADRLDGEPLVAHHGAVRLVEGGDEPGTRSVRMFARLRIVTVNEAGR
ncbi:MAG: hypothetical protein KIT83_01020 [Bryobacterales bacterium]|nr:hypothetical protein [Bryobacterales bacterium]